MEIVAKSETEIMQERKEKLTKLFKEKKEWVVYGILGIIVMISFWIRTLNVSKLKDITTNSWTLGPDLDPFLFLRWAKDVVANGHLVTWDYMRYVPLGYNTSGEMKLLAYMIDWFYHFLSFFSKDVSVTYAAIMFPAVMFALTGIAFFLFARKVFYKEDKKIANIIALISTAFFVMIPSLLPRTIAGIPEKESAAFFFMFMSFYLFLEAFTSENLKKGLILGAAAGLMTGLMALIWGGFIFVYFAIPPTVLFAFILGKIDLKKYLIYVSWVITSFLVMMPFSTRYTLGMLIRSTSTGFGLGVAGIIGLSFFIMSLKQLETLRKKTKLPKEIFALIISFIIIGFFAVIALGPSFFIGEIKGIKNAMIQPMTTRFGLTVAENKQPYFISDWSGSFGPVILNVPLYFWLFFSGSVVLFYNLVKRLKFREKSILTVSYLIFLICLIFSRYEANSILNGTSGLSILVYFSGWLLLTASFVYVYYLLYKEKRLEIFKKFEFSYLLYFMILTLGIIGARAGIRLIMVLGAISPIAVGFLIVRSSQKYLKEKDDTTKFFMAIITIIILLASLFTLWGYFQANEVQASNFAPGVYQWQWQKAMAWVRENTPANAVFAHWWDYGYWVQSIGERATILDGGNAIVYWNHLMGRYVLTGTDEMKSLEFLYSHNGTHLLIDSTDIGKYTAYSSIGADENYDRFSWITTFLINDKYTQETNNETTYLYTGGTAVDEDIIWNFGGKDVLFPKKSAGIGAVILKQDENKNFMQPFVIFVYNNQQYNIPIRYIYYNDKEYDFGSGLESGIFIFPQLKTTSSGSQELNKIGALFYLSNRTVHSELAKLYLYNEKSDYFRLVHTEDSLVVESMKNQGIDVGNFVYYQGFQGPIKIWEINYPTGMKVNEDYLKTDYPNQELSAAKEGEYN